MNVDRLTRTLIFAGLIMALSACSGSSGGSSPAPVPQSVCQRFAPGSVVQDPPTLFSVNGVLTVNLAYNTATDAAGRTLYCFTTPDGREQPTLVVNPGDTLVVNVTNNLPAPTASSAMQMETTASDVCGAATMNASSVNIHYHGTNTSPTCHSDEVVHTLINSGQSFTYNIQFPTDEPSGLYWYHPHVHGLSEAAVQGGATGAIIVTGIQNSQPAVAGLTQRVLLIRDQNVPGNPTPGGPGNVPSWDLSLNYIPIPYPSYTPAIIQMQPGERQLWRVVNASADTLIDLQMQYDGQPQTLQVVGLDGVPTGSQDGTGMGTIINETDILLQPASRAEFIVTGPSTAVRNATLLTLNIDTGPDGDNDPQRPLATIQTVQAVTAPQVLQMDAVTGPPGPQRFAGLAQATPTAYRKLYFSEVLSDPSNPASPTDFYITVDGATPTLFSPDNPPAIVTTQGSVEDWTIENRSLEVHSFHIHQIHYLLEAIDGVPVPPEQQQFYDMIEVPYWTGSGPYPSVTVRMDFRGPVVGDFVYHCHILGHEDNGMMAIIQVLPAGTAANSTAPPKAGLWSRLEQVFDSDRGADRRFSICGRQISLR